MKKSYLIFFLLFIIQNNFAQYFYERNLSVSLNYTTNAKLYLNPFSSDPVLRLKNIELRNLYGYSFEYRNILVDDIYISFSIEHFKENYVYNFFNLSGEQATTIESFTFIPIEFCLYYHLPFSNDEIKFFMGGGSSIFWGSYKRTLANLISTSKMYKNSFGINISIGAEYFLFRNLGLRFQMKFRDPELIWNNTYNSNIVLYNDKTYLISSSNFYSKVNIDGINFLLGLVYNF